MSTPGLLGTPTISTEQDSEDLSDAEIELAVPTVDFNQLAQLLSRALASATPSVGEGNARYALARHEIRRRHPHLYLRSYLVSPGEPQRVLLHRIDWIESRELKKVANGSP